MIARILFWITVVLSAYAGVGLSAGLAEVILPPAGVAETEGAPFEFAEMADTLPSAAEIF